MKVTKEELIAAILACTEKLGHVPNLSELEKHTGVNRSHTIRFFGNYANALKACKLEKTGSGMRAETKDLFLDWARVVRAQKKIPLLYEYERDGVYSEVPFRNRFGTWSNVPGAMRRHAVEHGLTDAWQDVMDLIDGDRNRRGPGVRRPTPPPAPKILTERPMYGPLIRPFPLVCAPTNEFGVIFLFGALAEQLGFQVLRIQGQYPDGEALRVVAEDRLQRVKIEFEYQSRNFLRHGHDSRKCDLIVCWEHNWPEAPMEVIELKEAIRRQPSAASQSQNLNADLRA
jgi:HNH endonuclease